jgi:hypothetical protein
MDVDLPDAAWFEQPHWLLLEKSGFRHVALMKEH